MPYSEAVRKWRGGEEIWYNSPKNASPAWTNLFRRQDLPETIVINTGERGVKGEHEVVTEEMTRIPIIFTFDYPYEGFPQELTIYFQSSYVSKTPFVSAALLTPDGRELRIGDLSVSTRTTYRISQDEKLQRRLGGQLPHIGLFADPEAPNSALQGTYSLVLDTLVFEPEADVDAELVIYGQVGGLGGTDHRRRDLMIALLWGTPIALSFGLLAAVGTSLTTMIIAGVGTWFGGWVDAVIQRITEVNMILPFLPILIMIGTFYSRSLWVILGVVIVLSIFGSAIKTYRAIFLQVKESPYIEAAKAYGATSTRLIFRYLIPRIMPLIIPQLVVTIPAYVFLEASLALLGLGDPILPTWGKIINEAYANGALYQGQYYWVLEPAVLLMVTGLAFALVGFSLDRIFNPKLRGL
ncbi:MAG: ABC transporter permease [Anaerolineae bacterium]|nr:ABC transporter permease [Anaerolineae bacterium]